MLVRHTWGSYINFIEFIECLAEKILDTVFACNIGYDFKHPSLRVRFLDVCFHLI